MTPFTSDAKDLYFRDETEHQNCVDFVTAFAKNVWLQSLYWPNKSLAPWHLQMKVDGSVINFWPHKMKAHVAEESKTAQGIWEVVATVHRVKRESLEDFDVLEDEK